MTHLNVAASRAERANVPMSVLFELTERCNLDCQHCYLDIKNPLKNELSTDEVFAILDQLAAAGTLFLTFTGGEVLLRKDLVPILRHARKLGFAVRLFTSGTRMTWPLAREIASLGIVAVEMSLYGVKCEVHDAITRRPGSHRKTLRAALMLRRLGVKVALKSPILTPIQGEHKAFMKLTARIGAVGRLDPSVMPRRDGNTAPVGLRAAAAEIARAFQDTGLLRPGDALPPPKSPDEAPCAIARRTARVGADGKVYPCGTYPDPVGDLREKSFHEIWWGAPTPLLAKLRAFTFKDAGAECGSCSKSGYCTRCIAIAVIEHRDMAAVQVDACRVTHARDLAVENGAPLPPGLLAAEKAKPRHRSLPIVG